MAFHSFEYFLFLPAVFLLFSFSGKARPFVLLAASIAFYAALKTPYLLAVLALVTLFTYAVGIRLGAHPEGPGKRALFTAGIAGNVLILCLMKYLPLIPRVAELSPSMGRYLEHGIVITGVSYFTFQAISYLIDIYLGMQQPERSFSRFALYIAYFPKLLQGPIERGGDLLPQLKEPYRFDYDTVRSGMLLFSWGLFKKVVIADRLAIHADQVFNNVHQFTGLSLLIGIYAYAFQIFFDFSGYTDMARGTSRIFGIELTENFNSPYLATSVADFWRRWHISFSRWILDYIFKPLQIVWRNHGRLGTAAALMVTFIISGMWHGASWGFIIWGGLHGGYMVAAIYSKPHLTKVYRRLGIEKSGWLKWWQIFATFNLVSFAWIFFRAGSLADAWYIVTKLFQPTAGGISSFLAIGRRNPLQLSVVLSLLALATLYPPLASRVRGSFSGRYRWLCYYLFIMTILVFGLFGKSEFIYGRF